MAQTTVIKVHYNAGWGRKITIRGDGDPFNWEEGVEAVWSENDCWTYSFEMEPGWELEYKVLLDDALWMIGSNQYIQAGECKHLFPFFETRVGRVEEHHHFDMPLSIYLPPSYDENEHKSYPVLYMHDGQNLFDPTQSFKGQIWGVHETVDRLVGEGLMDEIIAVGIYNRGAGRLHDMTPSHDPNFLGIGAGGGAAQYADLIINEIKPFIDSTFRSLPQRENTGLMGASLGGLVSLYMARTYHHVFGKVASLSSSFWWNNRQMLRQIVKSKEYIPLQIYLDAGTHNDGLPETRRMYDALIECGYSPGKDLFFFVAPKARHSEIYWARRLHIPLRFLFHVGSTVYRGDDLGLSYAETGRRIKNPNAVVFGEKE